jgi:hypothetical protein
MDDFKDREIPLSAAFLAELHDRKLKVTLNDHPADGVQNYEDLYPLRRDGKGT